MRTLIDGYNLMYTLVHPGKRQGPDGFRKVRTRFLNDLAAALGAVAAHQTTVVFDASDPPGHLPRESIHKGMTIVYAVDDENADERIERLIAAHSAPKQLTVVSSDQRIRQAATRRKARAIAADAFWQELEAPRRGPPPPRRRRPRRRPDSTACPPARPPPGSRPSATSPTRPRPAKSSTRATPSSPTTTSPGSGARSRTSSIEPDGSLPGCPDRPGPRPGGCGVWLRGIGCGKNLIGAGHTDGKVAYRR